MEKRENFSRKRMAILNALREAHNHPTADWIYHQLKPLYPKLSLGTVYRNLRKFCESGTAVSLGVISGQERFDATVSPHSHFVCRECGQILDVPQTFFDKNSLSAVSESTGLSVQDAKVVFYGICGSCRQNAQQKK